MPSGVVSGNSSSKHHVETSGCLCFIRLVYIFQKLLKTMDIGDEDNINNYDEMQKIIEEADEIVLNLLPQKSKAKYMAVYEKFAEWRKERNIAAKDTCEEVVLVYLKSLFEEHKLKPPTVWSRYSMLKSTLLSCETINMRSWDKVISFMKKQAKGYCPKKAKIFTAEDITKFCAQAPDESYLVEKVVLILGMTGGLRREEIYNICLKDITESDNSLLISIPKTKNGEAKSFVVMGELRKVIDKYRGLRPAVISNDKFLINYQKGRCTTQVIGINKIGNMPKKIAAYLKKENPDSYSGHSFRRTSATLLVDAGADIMELKRHGGWKSNAVAEGYIGDSIDNKKRTYSRITESIETQVPKKQLLSSTQADQLPARSFVHPNPSASTSHNKENISNAKPTENPCIYQLNNCTVNIVHNQR